MSAKYNQMLLLNELSDEQLQLVIQRTNERSYENGDAIIWQGDPCEAVFCVISGEIEIFRLSPSGREQILDRMRAGHWFNLVPGLLPEAKNQANVRALTDCRLLVITKSVFIRLIEEIPPFGIAVTRYFARRLAHMTDLLESISLYSVRQRLAQFLIEQADQRGGGFVRWTQTDIANRLGTVRDVIGRALRRMSDEGMLRVERENILLLDREKLEKAAAGDE